MNDDIDEAYDSGLECARCTLTPSNAEEAQDWLENGSWSAEFYEDGTPGGFCPACADWLDSDA